MNHERTADVLAVTGWLGFFASVAIEINPILQSLSLILACVASVCAIVFYTAKIHDSR